jgi:hypothetical protein
MHEVNRIFPSNNLASNAPYSNASVSAFTLTTSLAPTFVPTSTTPGVHCRLHIKLLLIFRWLLLLVLRA